MSAAISMVDATPARGDLPVCMQECNGHLGHAEFINGPLVD
jgi:hypothetical protein